VSNGEIRYGTGPAEMSKNGLVKRVYVVELQPEGNQWKDLLGSFWEFIGVRS